METLLYDNRIHDVLLQVLCIRENSLEELYFNQMLYSREIEWIQQAVYSACVALSYVTGDTAGLSSNWNYLNVARCVRFSPDECFMATGSTDTSIKLFV